MKKLFLLLIPMMALGTPNGYFRLNQDGTIDMIASEVIVDDVTASNATFSGNISVTGAVSTVDTIQMDTSFSDGVAEGRIQWNSDDGTLEYGLPGGNVTLQVGAEQLMKVTNKTGAVLTNGLPVYISGAQGSRPTAALADALVPSKHHVVGVLTEDIANNGNGYVCTYGYVRDIDTSAWNEGSTLYLGITPGTFVTNIPAYPAEPQAVATVLFSNADSGIILVQPQLEMTFDHLADTDLKVHSLEYTATNIYNDLRFPFSAINLPGLGADPAKVVLLPDGTVNAAGCISAVTFASGDYLFFSPQMSHDYWDGTVLSPHLHSISTATPVTNTYNLIYSYADIGDTYSTMQTNTVTISTSGVAGEHELHNLGDMDALGTLGGTEVSSMIGVRLQRTDAGTSINLTEFDIHYRIRYGGGQEYP